jgi:hypothetical protein
MYESPEGTGVSLGEVHCTCALLHFCTFALLRLCIFALLDRDIGGQSMGIADVIWLELLR